MLDLIVTLILNRHSVQVTGMIGLGVVASMLGLPGAGIAVRQFEDHDFRRRCSHTPGRRVIPARGMVGEIEVAADAWCLDVWSPDLTVRTCREFVRLGGP